MHRAGKRSVAAAALVATLLGGSSALAFHAGKVFDKPPGAGGADGIYYSGSPLEHGWKCTLCHTNPEGKISLHISQPQIFTVSGQQPYTPGQTYQFDVDLVGEHLGMQATQSNYNSLAVQILDANLQPAGGVLYAEDDFYSGFAPTTIVSANASNTQIDRTHWTFRWIAPGPMDGPDGGPPLPVTFYFAAVDGNGADAGPDDPLTDPFGDDFFSVAVTLQPTGAKTGALTPPPPPAGDASAPPTRDGAMAPVVASAFTMAAFGLAHWSRRGRKRARPRR